MKNFLFLLLTIFFLSCENKPELDGLWIILKSTHNGKEIFPQTVSRKARIKYNIAGYEGKEIIHFKTSDSTAILPGFNSDKLEIKFNAKTDLINFELINEELYQDIEFDLTKNVFLQQFNLITQTRPYIIELKSDSTYIKLIDFKHIIENQVNNLLK
ncbi:hypothetical protein [Lacinutrix algicola]|uniref:hypothetical protein n=1 Tax=Lacinutrix algicola TaxID=342954 RepID=UPI0006E1322D|nr:hypothetical protein [Lacinutrix algicola]